MICSVQAATQLALRAIKQTRSTKTIRYSWCAHSNRIHRMRHSQIRGRTERVLTPSQSSPTAVSHMRSAHITQTSAMRRTPFSRTPTPLKECKLRTPRSRPSTQTSRTASTSPTTEPGSKSTSSLRMALPAHTNSSTHRVKTMFIS